MTPSGPRAAPALKAAPAPMKIYSDQTLFISPRKTPEPAAATQMAAFAPSPNEAGPAADKTSWILNDATVTVGRAAPPPPQDSFDDDRTRLILPISGWGEAATSVPATLPPLNRDLLIHDRYEILKEQPSGDHSDVYLAEDVHSGALVILKTVSDASLHSDEARNMMLREAEALRDIASDGIPACKGLFYCQGRLFLAMERVRGVVLERLIAARQVFSFDSSLGLLEAVLQILKTCHARGHLHGDIKPSNIVLRNSRPVLIDWGSTQKHEDDDFKLISLTPKFAAPEANSRYEGSETGRIGPWSDIYSAFSTAATCLIGTRDRVTLDAVKAVLDRERGQSDGLPPDAFDAIEALFATGLAAAPEARFQTAADAIAQIAAVRDKVFQTSANDRAPVAGEAQVFVSYSRKDADEVAKIIEGLEKIGLKPWVDQSAIHAGDEWMAKIVTALKQSALVIVYCTENSVGADAPSKHVRREIDLAFESKKRVAPVFPAGQQFALDGSAAYLLSGLHRQDWTGDPDAFANSLRAIL